MRKLNVGELIKIGDFVWNDKEIQYERIDELKAGSKVTEDETVFRG